MIDGLLDLNIDIYQNQGGINPVLIALKHRSQTELGIRPIKRSDFQMSKSIICGLREESFDKYICLIYMPFEMGFLE
jgi:hypothetical protein